MDKSGDGGQGDYSGDVYAMRRKLHDLQRRVEVLEATVKAMQLRLDRDADYLAEQSERTET